MYFTQQNLPKGKKKHLCLRVSKKSFDTKESEPLPKLTIKGSTQNEKTIFQAFLAGKAKTSQLFRKYLIAQKSEDFLIRNAAAPKPINAHKYNPKAKHEGFQSHTKAGIEGEPQSRNTSN